MEEAQLGTQSQLSVREPKDRWLRGCPRANRKVVLRMVYQPWRTTSCKQGSAADPAWTTPGSGEPQVSSQCCPSLMGTAAPAAPVWLPGDFGKRCAGLGTSVLGQQVEWPPLTPRPSAGLRGAEGPGGRTPSPWASGQLRLRHLWAPRVCLSCGRLILTEKQTRNAPESLSFLQRKPR